MSGHNHILPGRQQECKAASGTTVRPVFDFLIKNIVMLSLVLSRKISFTYIFFI